MATSSDFERMKIAEQTCEEYNQSRGDVMFPIEIMDDYNDARMDYDRLKNKFEILHKLYGK